MDVFSTRGPLGLLLLYLFSMVIPPAVVCQQSINPSEPLLGLWGATRQFGPEVKGLLRLGREGEAWWAAINGYRVPVQVKNSILDFELPGDRGAFRGYWDQAQQHLSGHWIQPPDLIEGCRYATPVKLESIHPGLWQGVVEPKAGVLTLYLLLQRQEDGSIAAMLRNPERNIGIFYGIMRVERNNSSVRFVDREGEILLEGIYRAEAEQLAVFFPFNGGTFDFSPRNQGQAAGFYPRTIAARQYEYHQPIETGDGWATASPADTKINAEPLHALVQQVLDTETRSVYAPYMQALLIAHKDKLVLEEYFYGFHSDLPHDTRSAGKTLTAALIGLALEHGAPFDLRTPLFALLGEDTDNLDPRKHRMTIEHLLTMTSGFACDDDDSNSPGNEGRMQNQQQEPDWFRFALDLPMAHNPGEQGVYCTAGINLLGAAISRTTGIWLPRFFEERFARPLDIHHYHINLQPMGDAYLGGGIRLRPRDFLKLGQLYLNQGRWQDRQLLCPEWILRSTTPQASIYESDDYGYAWWLKTYDFQGRKVRSYYASGNGGQLLIVLPELDTVILFMGGNYNNFATWGSFRDDLVPQYIIPSVIGG